jgi:hypothetical protein
VESLDLCPGCAYSDATGVFERVDGEEEARATPEITSLEITVRLNDFIAAWPEGLSYLGFIFARAAEPAEAEDALGEAHRKLRFTITSRFPVEHPLSHKVSPSERA